MPTWWCRRYWSGSFLPPIVTWTVWLAKSIELMAAGRRVRRAIAALAGARSSAEGAERINDPGGEVGRFLAAAGSRKRALPPAASTATASRSG